MPDIGFGTYQCGDGAAAAAQVEAAVRCGYRLLDTAASYENEEAVGEGIRRAGLPREQLFLTSKLRPEQMSRAGVQAGFAESCRKLGVEYLDLYLIHWPRVPAIDPDWERANAETWRAMEELHRQGLARAIGVCNFLPHHLAALDKTARIQPMVDQLEFHPGWRQPEALACCRGRGILVEAWSPLGRSRMAQHPLLNGLARKYGCDVGQLCIRYAQQSGTVPLPRTSRPERLAGNLHTDFFTIVPEDMAALDSLPETGWSGQHPDRQKTPGRFA